MGMTKEEFRNRVMQDQLERQLQRDNEYFQYKYHRPIPKSRWGRINNFSFIRQK